MTNNKVKIFPLSIDDPLFGETLGCGIRIIDRQATIADYLRSLDEFAAAYLADCRGCTACCQERAPLIAPDIYGLLPLTDTKDFPAHSVCTQFAEVVILDDGAADIYLKREQNNLCNQANRERQICSIHPNRPFVCRSHFCLPQSDLLHRLREELVNQGEDELIRMLLAEEEAGFCLLMDKPLAQMINPADYPATPMSNKACYEDILIKDTVSDKLWQELIKEID